MTKFPFWDFPENDKINTINVQWGLKIPLEPSVKCTKHETILGTSLGFSRNMTKILIFSMTSTYTIKYSPISNLNVILQI